VSVPEVDRETRQAVADVMVRYATGIDRRDWALFRTCFTDDCDVDYGDIGHWHGAEAVTAWMDEVHAQCGPTLHRITNQAVVAKGDGVAARAYVDAVVMGADGLTGVRATGHYDDELVRTDDGWRIARRRFTLVLAEPVGAAPPGDDVEAIRTLKARYFRTMDTKDWAAMREVFCDDVEIDTTESGGSVVTGASEFMAFLEETIGDVVTVHHGHMPEIEITSPTTATGVWAMEDWLRWPNGMELHGFGHYHETYEKVEGAWGIKSSRLTRLRMDFTEAVGDTTSGDGGGDA